MSKSIEAGLAAQKEFGNKLIRGFTQEEVNQLQKLTEKLYDNMKREEECNG